MPSRTCKSRWHILAERTAQRVQLRREALISKLGGKCCRCGTTSNLEFNHTHPRDWEAYKVSRLQRMGLYERDYQNGHLNLLCQSCNKKYGTPKAPLDPNFVPDF